MTAEFLLQGESRAASQFVEVVRYIEGCSDVKQLNILAQAIAVQRSQLAIALLSAFEEAVMQPDSEVKKEA